jgi:hypothetical protein
VNRLLLSLAVTTTVGSLLFSGPSIAQHPNPGPSPDAVQIPPPAPKAAKVEIVEAPAPELVRDGWAIIRWRCTNPGGTDKHVAIARFGTDPNNLSQTATSPVQINRTHQNSTFRVLLEGLKPGETYYYTVTSAGSDGSSDGVQSPVSQFTMPGRS